MSAYAQNNDDTLYLQGYEDAFYGLSFPMFRKEKDDLDYREGYEAGKAARDARQKPAIAWTDATLIAEGYCR